jgi:hypothetical protein
MSRHLLHFGRIKLRAGPLLEALVLCLLWAFSILDWLAHLSLTQDSATYIVAAKNLLESGRLTFLINYTNWMNAPSAVPYFEQPPGFPLVLVPFMAVLRDPIISAAVAQSAYLGLYYAAIYLMTRRLKFSRLLRLVTLLLFTFVSPFALIHRFFWTETLFIALTLTAGYFAIGLLTESSRRRDWVLLAATLALSAAVKYTGVANVALVAPLLMKRETLREALRLICHRYVLTAVAVGGSLLIALSLLADLLPVAEPGIGPMQWRGIGIGVAGLLVGSAGLFFSRRSQSNREGSESPIPSARPGAGHAPAWPLLAVFAAGAPAAVWIVRNKLMYDVVSTYFVRADGFSLATQVNRLVVPFLYIWNDLLSFRVVPRPLVAVLVIGFVLLPLLTLPMVRTSGSSKLAQISILGAATAHFMLLLLLSFILTNETIGERYFVPVLALLILGVLNGLQQVSASVRPQWGRQALLASPVLFLVLSGMFSPPDLSVLAGTINYPRERQLWSEINSIDWTRSSSYFYSDGSYSAGGYIHQIFSGKPQGILWDPNVLRDPEILRHILSNGVNPFILVTETGYEAGILNEMSASGAVPLERILFHDTGFALYYLSR